jgi:hypothetical protein
MFRWENHYYKDICSPTLTVRPVMPDEMDPADTPILGMTQPEVDAEAKQEMCKVGRTQSHARLNYLKTLRAPPMAPLQRVHGT